MFVFLPGSCVLRDASGNINDTLSTDSSMENCIGTACQYNWDFSECMKNGTCNYGLLNYYQVNKDTGNTKTSHM